MGDVQFRGQGDLAPGGDHYGPNAGRPVLGDNPFGNPQQNMPASAGIQNLGAPAMGLDAEGNPIELDGGFMSMPLEGDFNLQNPGFGERVGRNMAEHLQQQSLSETLAPMMAQNLMAPGAGQQFWANAQNLPPAQLDQVRRTLSSNIGRNDFAARQLQQLNASRPDIAADPGLGPYYENAERRALESIDQASAAAGGYGSSMAGDQRSEAITNLNAERANREADYNLRRLAEQRMFDTAAMQGALGASNALTGWTQAATGRGRAITEEEIALRPLEIRRRPLVLRRSETSPSALMKQNLREPWERGSWREALIPQGSTGF